MKFEFFQRREIGFFRKIRFLMNGFSRNEIQDFSKERNRICLKNPISDEMKGIMRKFKAGHYYHLYNRGVNRQPIFLCNENRGYFLKRLREYCLVELIDIIAYCFMPNHYHLMVYLKTDELSSKIMQPFTISYTKAVNRQQNRTGPLFQGRFKALLIDKDEYLLHLSRYIHLNPVMSGLAGHPAEWVFSSYRDYVGLRHGTFPKPDIVLSRFPSRQMYAKFVESYVKDDKDDKKQIEHLMLD